MSSMQCLVVTPERTEVDIRAESVTVPLFDGELGILKGHSPLVGRLGYGVLRIESESGTKKYFVEGGFIQVAKDVVSVLTDKVLAADKITAASAAEAMQLALDLPADREDLRVARQKAVQRARALARVAG